MSRILLLLGSFALVALGSFVATTQGTEAHERRTVGAYNFVVGWLNEPAYLNEPNAVDLRVSRASDATPVTGLEQTLKVEVTQGSQKITVDLRPRFNTPGAYDGRLMPTAPGVYAFRFVGTIDGQQVNETFTASDSTFAIIAEPPAFPNPYVGVGSVDETVQGLESRIVELESDSGGSSSGTTFGIIGIVVGALGLAVAGYSLTRKAA
jgi:hypothetical protein